MLVVVVTACFFTSCHIYDVSKSTHESLDIYLLIGQSNMAGRAPIEAQDSDTLANVLLFTGNESKYWEPAANPLNKYSSIRKELSMQKLGPGYYFAKTLAHKMPHHNIGLVVNARGGTSINEWMPGTNYYTEAILRTKTAMKYGRLRGIIWHQGESDVKEYSAYNEKLARLILSLRADLGNDQLPFIAGELSEDQPDRIKFNATIRQIPVHMKYTGVASASNLTTIDSTHFDAKSQRVLGERYAIEYMKLLSQP